jgi:hypothetical protein
MSKVLIIEAKCKIYSINKYKILVGIIRDHTIFWGFYKITKCTLTIILGKQNFNAPKMTS